MSGYEIEKGIPVPAHKRGGGKGAYKYPFADMDIGDSFAAPAIGKSKSGLDYIGRNRVGAAAARWCKDNAPGRRFITRVIDENTVRVWRVA